MRKPMTSIATKQKFRWLVATGFFALAACVTIPTLDDVAAGKVTVVMARFAVDAPGDPGFGPFENDLVFNLGIRWGDIETGGVPTDSVATWYKYISVRSRREGWVYFLLKPGRHYMGVLPAHAGQAKYASSLKYEELFRTTAPRWIVNVPAGVPVVYAGTLDLGRVLVQKPEFSLGAKRWIADFNANATTVRDETARATQLARAAFSRFGNLKTALMRRHTDDTYRF